MSTSLLLFLVYFGVAVAEMTNNHPAALPHHHPRNRRVRPACADEADGGGVFTGRGARLNTSCQGCEPIQG